MVRYGKIKSGLTRCWSQHWSGYGPSGLARRARLDSFAAQFPQQRKVLIHINNTNPILNEQSVEHATLKQLEIEVSYDGMLIEV